MQTYLVMVCMAVFFVSGCASNEAWQEPGPEAVFEQFLLHWFVGEQDKAWEMVAPEDRKELLRAREDLKKVLAPLDLPKPYEMLKSMGVASPYDFKKIARKTKLKGVLAKGTLVELKLHFFDGRESDAALVWSGTRWFVDLPVAGSVVAK